VAFGTLIWQRFSYRRAKEKIGDPEKYINKANFQILLKTQDYN